MLIELHTQQTGRWYWVTCLTNNTDYAVRLVQTQMDPNNIAVSTVACKVYGCCEYVTIRERPAATVAADGAGVVRGWQAKSLGLNLSRGDSVRMFDTVDAAKTWLLGVVAHRLRRTPLSTPRYASPFQVTYKYEAIGC